MIPTAASTENTISSEAKKRSGYPRTLIIIPTYNERENINLLIQKLFALYPDLDIFVVDDDSPDGTQEAVQEAKTKYGDRLEILVRVGERGRGSAVLAGLKRAKEKDYDLAFEMDADLSHRPEDLKHFFDVASSSSMVVGSRYVKGGEVQGWGLKRKMLSRCANLYERILLGVPLSDYTTGYRCYGKEAIDVLLSNPPKNTGYIMLSEIAYLLHQGEISIREVPILFMNRQRGSSKVSPRELLDCLIAVPGIRFPWMKKHLEQGLKFALVGSSAAMIDLGSLAIFVELFGVDPRVAVIPSTLLAVTYVFLLNKHFTFKNKERQYLRQALKFAVVYGLAVILNLALFRLFFWLGIYYLLSKMLAIGILAAWNYSLSHFFVFAKRRA